VVQLIGLKTITVDAGYFSNLLAGRMGRFSNPPPQFGQICCKTVSTQVVQKVHSKLQMCASLLSGGKALLQFSQVGFNINMFFDFRIGKK